MELPKPKEMTGTSLLRGNLDGIASAAFPSHREAGDRRACEKSFSPSTSAIE